MQNSAVHTDLRNREYLNWLSFLKASELWDQERILDYQLREFQKILNIALSGSAGYQSLYKKTLRNKDQITCLADISMLPFSTKEMIRDNLDAFTIPVKGMKYVTTGGSTGIPFGFYRTNKAFSKELASKAYQYYRVGWKEGDRQMVFRGLPVQRKNHCQFYPSFNELRCSSYHLVPDKMDYYLKKADEYKPEWIRCYPSSGYILAKYMKQTGKRIPGLKGVLCASENLYDYQKQLMKEVFSCRIFSHYGHYELAVLAGFCEYEDTYHVLPQYGYVELLDSKGLPVTKPGMVGEIVATSFIMEATPFIRYRTRDYAVLKDFGCPSCRRPYQVWEKIEGRLQEFIVTSTGRYISMTAMNMHDDIFDHIKQFQFYQDTIGKVIFNYIPKDDCTENVVQEMKFKLLKKFGSDIELLMNSVEDIPFTKRGKARFLIQKLPLEFHDE